MTAGFSNAGVTGDLKEGSLSRGVGTEPGQSGPRREWVVRKWRPGSGDLCPFLAQSS